ncbi:MAG: TIGR04282 family arsenosugar biosynthesis glycosyltransferase [Saprospiraceae bacterium]
MKNALIIFIKNIVPGKVKTRLAATVGTEQAIKIYAALLERTRKEALKTNADLHVFYSNEIIKNDEWDDSLFIKNIQRGNNIGARMSNAFLDIMPPYKKVILIGGDIAQISAAIIEEGFEKLMSHDFVLGPAHDGGYYLIGQTTPTPFVFENIEWSTENVSQKTLENIKSLNKTCYLLPTLSDIDYEEDWVKYGWDI